MNDRARTAYEAWHAGLAVDAGAGAPWHELVTRQLVPIRDLSGRRVLEVACGRGGFATWLAGQGPAPIVGEDFSREAVRKGKAFAATRDARAARWAVSDAHHLPHADQSFDTVISCETVEHLPDPRRAIREFARVLRRGGRLFLTTPNYLGVMGLYRAYRRLTGRPFTEEGQPINRFVMLPRTLAWVQSAGLVVRHRETVGHYLPVPRRAPVRLAWFDNFPPSRWFGLHSLVVAERA